MKVQERNRAYYAKFPEDIGRVNVILRHLKDNTVRFSDGAHLTPERFLQLGIQFGMHGTESLYYEM